ncbi:MAG: hypothetical protein JF599_11905 [Verrucomicrobia bacterium]|nr:hypothetical protein [Verrucomicrobiota bacterium]
MKPQGGYLVNVVSYAIVQRLLFLGFFIGGILLGLPFIYFSNKYHIAGFYEIGGVIILIGFFASVFTTREIIYRMKAEGTMLYGKATAHTLYGYLRVICFLPIIGPYIRSFVERNLPKSEERPLAKPVEVTPVSGFDECGDPSICSMDDGSLYLSFEFMPPSWAQANPKLFEAFDAQLEEVTGLPVIWENREFFIFKTPRPDTAHRISKFLHSLR